MKHSMTAAAISLLVLVTACGSTAAALPPSPQPGAVQCSRLRAAEHQISTDTYAGVARIPGMLAIVASRKEAGWFRMLHHAATAPGPARAGIALAEAGAANLGLDAKLAEDGAGPARPVTKDWQALRGDLRRADAACQR